MDQKQKIYAAALKRISMRAMSTSDLRKKLREKFPNDFDEIDVVIDEMVSLHLISDERYCELLVNHLLARPVGRQKLFLEGRKHGLSQEQMERQLQAIDYDEFDVIEQAYLHKKKGLPTHLDSRAFKQKMTLFLRNRGFRDSLIFKIISQYAE